MLNNDDGTITFILQMAVAPATDDVESWISERSSRVTFEFEEMKTRRFEWFLSSDKTKATLIEVFDDSEGALTRFNNLISSPIAPEWMDRFEVVSQFWVTQATSYGRHWLLWNQIFEAILAVLPGHSLSTIAN